MLSQDRHEIYLTIAEYDAAYVRYATGVDPTSARSFLRMTQYGPYVVSDPSDMSKFGYTVLAFTIQACR